MPNVLEKTPTLQTIQLERDYKKWIAGLDFAAPAHADRTIDRDALILTPTGAITALLLKNVLPLHLLKKAFEISAVIRDRPDGRSAAVGSKSMPRILKDGRRGTYHATPNSVVKILERDDVRQGVFGAIGRRARRPPELSKLTREKPEFLSRLRPLIEEVNQL